MTRSPGASSDFPKGLMRAGLIITHPLGRMSVVGFPTLAEHWCSEEWGV